MLELWTDKCVKYNALLWSLLSSWDLLLCALQEVDEEDEQAFEVFMSKDIPARRTLADVIMEKIRDKKTEIESQMSGLRWRSSAVFTKKESPHGFFKFIIITSQDVDRIRY